MFKDLNLTDKEKEKWLQEIGVLRHKPFEFSLFNNNKHIMLYSREYLENTTLEELKQEHEKNTNSKYDTSKDSVLYE